MPEIFHETRLRYGALRPVLSLGIAALSAASFCLSGAIAKAQVPAECVNAKCAFRDTSLPIEQRVKDLVSHMTVDEEISQTLDMAVAIPRLGIPRYNWWSEALHGVARNGAATNFPQAIGLAATFDTKLMRGVADVIATEGRAKYNEAVGRNDLARFSGLTFWSPNLNIFRDPRWGRGQETFGEDPYLTSRMGVEFVEGLQGDDPKYLKLIATPKHFAVHSGPEQERHRFDARISDHDLEDTYLPAFRASVVEAKAGSIMCAYNSLDGVPVCASTNLLQLHLRDAWGFKGYVVSDCDSVADVLKGHHYVSDRASAAAVSLKAGTDLDCGTAYEALKDAIDSGKISKADLDMALERLFTARMRLGMFDPPGTVPYDSIPASSIDSPAHRSLALQAARESIVLLKNDGILPLRKGPATIAVVGPTADLLESIEGNYNGHGFAPVTPLLGMELRFGGQSKILYAPGSVLAEGAPSPIPPMYLRPDSKSAQNGLKGEYFNSWDFSATPSLTRIDKKINFDWNRDTPAPGIATSQFGVRWTGEFLPPVAGEYILSFRANRRSREDDPATVAAAQVRFQIFVDDKMVLDNRNLDKNAHLLCQDTSPHSIRIEYRHFSEDRAVDLEWQPPSAKPLRDYALSVVSQSDVVIAFVGLSPNLEGEEMAVHADGFEGGDRSNITLPAVQEELLEAIAATGKPLVVVLTSGSAVTSNWAQEHARAILAAWYPGEEGGTAIAQTIAGENNPAGRLPITIYRSVSDLPAFTDYSMRNRTYRYFGGQVLYPFGFGLSYSTFEYQRPSLSEQAIRAGDSIKVSTTVENSSSQSGDEVVQLYITPPHTPFSPRLALEGFQRIHLESGQKKQVTFLLDPWQLSEVDEQGNRSILPGDYAIYVGGSQPDLAHANSNAATLRVSGVKHLPK